MSLLARFKLWRDQRALERIRVIASLLVSPDFAKGVSDDALTDFLIRNEHVRAEHSRELMRSLPQIARDLESLWYGMIDFLDPAEVERRVQAYAESLREDAERAVGTQ